MRHALCGIRYTVYGIWYLGIRSKQHSSPHLPHPAFRLPYTIYRIPYTIYRIPCAFIFGPMNMQDDLQTRWWQLQEKLMQRFGKKPDMEAILFLIGIQEFGEIRQKFTKERK